MTGSDRKVPQFIEVRTYHISPDQATKFWERFENVTSLLFKRLGFRLGPAWVDTEYTHQFTYLLYWSSEEAMLRSWQLFLKQPEWLASKVDEGDQPYLIDSKRRFGHITASQYPLDGSRIDPSYPYRDPSVLRSEGNG
jgi:heme-degrading monooxygenase HmoA